MASFRASNLLYSSIYAPQLRQQKRSIKATLHIPKQKQKPKPSNLSLSNFQAANNGLAEELELGRGGCSTTFTGINVENVKDLEIPRDDTIEKLYVILEAVSDRIEMHKNVGEQRDNWNSLLLTSINGMTLAATTMSGISIADSASSSHNLASTLLYLAATGFLIIVNKIQPSQLAEEQRNAARLFQQLYNQVERIITIGNPTNEDAKAAMDKVLALDRAYPLPLLGVMLEKFPSVMEPSVWWPLPGRKSNKDKNTKEKNVSSNGWNVNLEEEMKEIVKVIRRKDKAEYMRLGGKALKLNKLLAISGPVLTGLAAIGSALGGDHGGWGSMIGVVAGALATGVNTLEHGGQVGMVFEMYRNNAGFFKEMEESIESNLMEEDVERRERGELLEMKVALQLGRSLSELRDLAALSSSSSSRQGELDSNTEEFASKLF